ncbi:MAG: glycyl radical enzyme domain-containing protein, partial [Acidimicrobiales bacterium]
HGEQYAAVSCYNSLKIGGGAHTLVRMNLKEVALRHDGTAEEFLTTTLPHYVELTAELTEARIRSLVEDQHFYDTHWLAAEGLIDID